MSSGFGVGEDDPFSLFDNFFGGMNHVNSDMLANNFASQFRSSARDAGGFDVFGDFIRMAQEGFQGPDQNKKPADKQAVARLPIVKISKEHCKAGEGGILEPPVCPICI